MVLGASPRPQRYSYLAVQRLVGFGHPVLAVGLREARIGDVPIVTAVPAEMTIDTVTLYLGRHNQAAWEDRILALRPRRIIFNPGAENTRLAEKAAAQGIAVENACTLVLLATGGY